MTEGENKPLEYPTIFISADVAPITKIDLAAAVEFNAVAANRNIRAVRLGMIVRRFPAIAVRRPSRRPLKVPTLSRLLIDD